MLYGMKIKAPYKLVRKYVEVRQQANHLLESGDVKNYLHTLMQMQRLRHEIVNYQ